MNNSNNVRTTFFGRARRIKLMKQVIIGALALLVLVILVLLVVKKTTEIKEEKKSFGLLKQYFELKGYTCEIIEKSGGHCELRGDNIQYIFTRYDEGFNYLVKASSYTIEIRHYVNTYNDIILTTNTSALDGDKSKTFTCTTNDGLLGEIQDCIDKNDVSVVNEVYLGAVQMTINQLNDIINNSGCNKNKLINEYYWEM